MPTVGTRRSTRVFVPKSKSSLRSDPLSQSPTAHIRSVKANNNSRQEVDVANSDWLSLFNDWARDRNRGAVADEPDQATVGKAPNGHPMEEKEEKTPDIVYTRKRARQKAESSGSNGQSKRYGSVYIRKSKFKRRKLEAGDEREGFGSPRISEKKAGSFVQEHPNIVPCSSWDLARKAGVSDIDITTRFKGSSVVLGVLVEMKSNRSSRIFLGFLLSVLGWIRSNSRAKIWRLISFLLKGPIGRVFSAHGVHFLPLLEGRDDVVADCSLPSIGVCKMHECSKTIPFLSLSFSSLPSYFTTLHLTISLPSLYIPVFISSQSSSSSKPSIYSAAVEDHAKTRSPNGTITIATCTNSSKLSETPIGICASSLKLSETRVGICASSSKVSETPVGTSASRPKASDTPTNRDKPLSYSTQSLSPLPEFSTILHSSKLRGHQQKKRSSTRITRATKSLAEKSISPKQLAASNINTFRPTPLDLPPDDSSQSGSDVSTPLGKYRRSSSVKSPVDRVHERLALAEAKQNIDSVRCKANLLVTQVDRCYREDDVTLSMEESESNEWLICVTLQDRSKFKHKPNEMRPCVVNRFTHAYMWTVDEVMRFEFIEKLDWLLFKELHTECRVRNLRETEKEKEVGPVQIPTPGVVVVPGYNLVRVSDRFVLPDTYIRVLDDEIQRVMKKDCAIYEADSDDESWLMDFNGRQSGRVTLGDFEMLISLIEKDAYSHPAGVGKIEGVYERCKELKRDDAVVGVYDYWLKRREVKKNALVRFFQWEEKQTKAVQPLELKPYIKKKRSFKRQRSQVVARPKPEQTSNNHDAVEDEAVRRVREAEADAKRAEEAAIRLRTRAQNLMEQAELATYRAVRRVREAEADAKRAEEAAIRLRTRAQNLMEQAELATYRAIMAVRIADALSRMSQVPPDPQADHDMMPFPSFD